MSQETKGPMVSVTVPLGDLIMVTNSSWGTSYLHCRICGSGGRKGEWKHVGGCSLENQLNESTIERMLWTAYTPASHLRPRMDTAMVERLEDLPISKVE